LTRAIAWALVLSALLGTAATGAVKYGPNEVAELADIAAAEKQPEGRRARAIRQLEHTEVRTHLGLLRRLLREERSLDIRLSAACTLAALGDRKAPKDLLLVSAYDGSKTPNCTRSDVLLALGRMGDADAEMHLERALQAPPPADEPFYYQDACRALLMLNTPGSRRVLLSASRGENAVVRKAVVTSLSVLARGPDSADRTAARQGLLLLARQDPDEGVAEQAASALFWNAVDGPGFFRMLEEDPEPKVRARAARVMNRQYLSPPRLQRLRQALAREKDESVRAEIERTLRGQKAP
jgi:hypothetical protein